MWLRFTCIESNHVWDRVKILIYLKGSKLAELSSSSALRKAFEMDKNSTNEGGDTSEVNKIPDIL